MYYVAIVIGAIIALLFGLNEALAKPDFKFTIFLKQNIGSTLLNILCGGVLVFAKDEISSIYTITFISSVVLGMSGQFLFKKVAKVFNPEENTFIGINDKTP
jgi:GR25 family glycosyltransferase involved in LPS biosynthesis